MQITLTLIDDEAGKWRVSAPNGHCRECNHTGSLSVIVPQVVKDYAEWLIRKTSIDHLKIEITNGGHKMTYEKSGESDGPT